MRARPVPSSGNPCADQDYVRQRTDRLRLPAYLVGMLKSGHRRNRAPVANNLLAALPLREYQRLLTGLEPVTLTFGEVLYEAEQPIRHVYFPSDSVVSLLTLVEGHMPTE